MTHQIKAWVSSRNFLGMRYDGFRKSLRRASGRGSLKSSEIQTFPWSCPGFLGELFSEIRGRSYFICATSISSLTRRSSNAEVAIGSFLSLNQPLSREVRLLSETAIETSSIAFLQDYNKAIHEVLCHKLIRRSNLLQNRSRKRMLDSRSPLRFISRIAPI